ncbi:MAG: hypothetical protein Q7S84_00945 [bacterium]|nr:hypothetical protein [bacterium]
MHILRFRKANKNIWRAIKNGTKRVETRAATPRYQRIGVGERVRFVCGTQSFTKSVRHVRMFRTVPALTRAYRVKDINPFYTTTRELTAMYRTFPGYTEKIKRYGIVAFELQ